MRASLRTTTTSGWIRESRRRIGRRSRRRSASRAIARATGLAFSFFSAAQGVSLQVVRAGTETFRLVRRDKMVGDPVTARRPIGAVRSGGERSIAVGNWPSGLYFARLTAPGGKGRVRALRAEAAPARRAQNRRCPADADVAGLQLPRRRRRRHGDTWYADRSRSTARLARPFENRGTPPHYSRYEEPFLRWLIATGRGVDYFADRDLRYVAGRALARAYDLLVFPGHHEYVTTHEYDVVTDFRDAAAT